MNANEQLEVAATPEAAVNATGAVELLLFRIGEIEYAADASQVHQVHRSGERALELRELGVIKRAERALEVSADDGVATRIRVDSILGMFPVPIANLRRLPNLVSAYRPYVVGFWLRHGQLIVLVDLHEVVRFSRTAEG